MQLHTSEHPFLKAVSRLAWKTNRETFTWLTSAQGGQQANYFQVAPAGALGENSGGVGRPVGGGGGQTARTPILA